MFRGGQGDCYFLGLFDLPLEIQQRAIGISTLPINHPNTQQPDHRKGSEGVHNRFLKRQYPKARAAKVRITIIDQ